MKDDGGPIIHRIKCDIKDLNLLKSLELFNEKSQKLEFVGISKHLCGVATDLAIRSLLKMKCDENEKYKFNGFLVAMCCRHRCIYNWLLPESKEYLLENFNINSNNFKYLKKLVSWATNGLKINEFNEFDKTLHFTGMNFKQREIIGLKARRIIDESRKYALLKQNYNVKLIKYVSNDISLENDCLLV
ncbi:hypothetical protein CANARDRAFT_30501, partial [[Candida] arabinofermentans NRRL YB-2248]